MFVVIKAINSLQREEEAPAEEPTTKEMSSWVERDSWRSRVRVCRVGRYRYRNRNRYRNLRWVASISIAIAIPIAIAIAAMGHESFIYSYSPVEIEAR